MCNVVSGYDKDQTLTQKSYRKRPQVGCAKGHRMSKIFESLVIIWRAVWST